MNEISMRDQDIIIIGGGLAGMVAAIDLSEKGKKVLLLERGAETKLGGLARESFGGITFFNSPLQQKRKIQDSSELGWQDWLSVAQFGDDSAFAKAWAKYYVENSVPVIYEWLISKGVRFFPVVHWVERGLYRPGNSLPRFHMVWGTGHGLIEGLKPAFQGQIAAGRLRVVYNCHIDQLIMKNANEAEGCCGKITHEQGTSQDFTARADVVIVAAGGICGNIALVKKYWHHDFGDPPETILNGAHPYGDGTLHYAVEKSGGILNNLEHQWNYAAGVHHPTPDRPQHGLSLVPPKSALWLNYRGERFGPMPLVTAYDTRYLVERICQERKKFSWQVMNWKIAIKELAVSGSQYNDAMRNKDLLGFLKVILLGNKKLVSDLSKNCVDFVLGNSPEELAEKMNALQGNNDIDPVNLKATIRDYDRQILRGKSYFNDEQLRRIAHLRQYKGDRVRTCKFQPILDEKALPLIAIREFILARKTLGGIVTNLEGRVINKDGKAFQNLFAIGEASGFGGGGSHGKGSLEGTFLGGCILTGRRTAEAIIKGL